jgi:hypothetical protein
LYGDNIMTRETKHAQRPRNTAFIGQKAHRLSSRAPFEWRYDDGFLVRQRVGGITYRRLDILYSETRIGVEQIVFGVTFTELSKNQFNRNARPAKDRLSRHHFWIDFAISNSHRASQQRLRQAPSFRCAADRVNSLLVHGRYNGGRFHLIRSFGRFHFHGGNS